MIAKLSTVPVHSIMTQTGYYLYTYLLINQRTIPEWGGYVKYMNHTINSDQRLSATQPTLAILVSRLSSSGKLVSIPLCEESPLVETSVSLGFADYCAPVSPQRENALAY